jgi:hypothetical protein
MPEQAMIAPPAPVPAKRGRGGARVGAGRPDGAKDRTTLQAEVDALQLRLAETTRQLEEARRGGAPVPAGPVETLEAIFAFWMGVAAQEQVEARAQGRQPNLILMANALDRADSAAGKASRFRVAPLASVDLGGQKDKGMEKAVNITISPEEAQL